MVITVGAERFTIDVRRIEGRGIEARATPVGGPGVVAGASGGTEERAIANLRRVLEERNAALAELAAMPVDAARAVVEEAKRRLAGQDRPQAIAGAEGSAGSSAEGGAATGPAAAGESTVRMLGGAVAVTGEGRIAVEGFGFIPANASTWRRLFSPSVDEVRAAVLNAVLSAVASAGVAYVVAQHSAPTPAVQAACDDTRRAVPALVIDREPMPPSLLPPLIGGAPLPTKPRPSCEQDPASPTVPRLVGPDEPPSDGDPDSAPREDADRERRGP
jgi:hypothetical protein